MRAVRAAAVLCVLFAGAPAVARAGFPGVNGQLGFSVGTTSDTTDIFAINADGTGARAVAVGTGEDSEPSWSADGEKVAWVSKELGRRQILLANADGTSPRRFAPSGANDFSPAWSPDGRSILFLSGRAGTGTAEIFVADADNNNVRRLTFRPLEDVNPQWSPDGTKIIWQSRETNTDGFHIYVMNSDGSDQHRLFPTRSAPDVLPSWSPDGQQIAWGSFTSALGYEIWIANADGTGARRILSNKNETYFPTWSPDGRRIAYVQRRGETQPFDLWTAKPDGSDQTEVITLGRGGTSFDWQPVAEHGAQPASLVRDGGTEDGFGGFFSQPAYLIPGWTTNGGMSVLRYGLPEFPSAASLPPLLAPSGLRQRPIGGLRGPSGGKRFFFGGNEAVSTAVQDVVLPAPAAEIDTGNAMATLSGLLGGRSTETDEGTVVATFLDGAGTALGALQIGPVTPAARNNATTFVSRMQTAKVPAGTRRLRVTLTATRHMTPFNDAYFDNLALVYTKPNETPPTKPPDPVEPPPTRPPGTPGAATTAPDLSAPTDVAPVAGAGRLTKLRLRPNRFAVGKGNTATIAATRRRVRRGARITFRLQRAGMVTMDIIRRRPGKRAKTVMTILRNGRTGANSVPFTGRLNGKRLAPGSYLLGASTTDAKGKRTKSVGAKFRIVRR